MNNMSIGKFLCLILRHKPNLIGITLDQNGWASTQEIIYALNKTNKKISIEQLVNIVNTDNKKRFSFNEDKSKIRANQGHSIPVDLSLVELAPPAVLYHGTSKSHLSQIRKTEIKPMTRQYVHLSADITTANKVGKRHGEVVVIEIDAKRMVEDGFNFFISDNGVWLTKVVSPKYFLNIIE